MRALTLWCKTIDRRRAMVASNPCHGPRCPICQKFFMPDARQGDGQKLCGRAPCRQEYKNQWQRQKYASNLPRSRAAVRTRVRRHRWNRRGKANAAPAVAVDVSGMVEALVRLEATLTGLAAHTMGCRNGAELGLVLSRCLDRGRDMLAGVLGFGEKCSVTGHVPEAERRCNGTRSRAWLKGRNGTRLQRGPPGV